MKQVRDHQFEEEFANRLDLAKKEKESAVKLAEAHIKSALEKELAEQKRQLFELKSQSESKKPEKLYFQNTNILYTLASDLKIVTDIGTIRETFFVNAFKEIYYSDIGDFVVDNIIFEVGGKGKNFSQIKDVEKSYLAIDVDTTTHKHKVPLWMFGFMY